MRTLLLIGSLAAAVPSTARADAPSIEGTLLHYYGAEKRAAWILGGLGVLSVGAGAVLVTQNSDFTRGLGWPLLGLGALEALGGIFYILQVDAEIAHYEALLSSDPASFRAAEIAHLEGIQRRFVFYRLSELAIAVGGAALATYGFIADRDVWKGAGIGLAAVGIPFFVIDSFNNARAGWYLDRVRELSPTVSIGAGGDGRPWTLAVAGRF